MCAEQDSVCSSVFQGSRGLGVVNNRIGNSLEGNYGLRQSHFSDDGPNGKNESPIFTTPEGLWRMRLPLYLFAWEATEV